MTIRAGRYWECPCRWSVDFDQGSSQAAYSHAARCEEAKEMIPLGYVDTKIEEEWWKVSTDEPQRGQVSL